MKRSSSRAQYQHSHAVNSLNVKGNSRTKNKTTSTVVHTENQNYQISHNTTKKSNLHKVSSCLKIPGAACNIKCPSKSSLLRSETKNQRKGSAKKLDNADTNAKGSHSSLAEENGKLRQQFCRLQQLHLKDKAKIQQLICRMSEIKLSRENTKTRPETPSPTTKNSHATCKALKCLQRRKKLQSQLYRQRIKVEQLLAEKQSWQTSRLHLKNQYLDLLQEVGRLKVKKGNQLRGLTASPPFKQKL